MAQPGGGRYFDTHAKCDLRPTMLTIKSGTHIDTVINRAARAWGYQPIELSIRVHVGTFECIAPYLATLVQIQACLSYME